MAAVQDQAALDLASSLTMAEIPIKLRCAVCSKLAVNAFKLPCCNQSICQDCQASLPEACPVCTHSPVKADMCKPNKSLRLTIKAFIKSEEKKRAAAAQEPTPAAVDAGETPVQQPEQEPPQPAESNADGAPLPDGQDEEASGNLPETAAEDAPHMTDPLDQVEQISEQPPTEDANDLDQAPGAEDDSIRQTIESADPENPDTVQTDAQDQDQKQSQDQDQSNSGFPDQSAQSMNWNGANGFNPMMNMAMMNGFPNMMGMPGMNPMSMFGGFGMQDMSGMNMGMGFGGGFGGGWNGQQGMGGGGNFGAGYYPNAGYNQPQMHQGPYANQQFPNHNYQNRFNHQRGGFAGRGRGAGGNGVGAGGGAPGGPSNNQFQAQNDDEFAAKDSQQGERRPSQAVAETADAGGDRQTSQSVAPLDDQANSEQTPAQNDQSETINDDTNEQANEGQGVQEVTDAGNTEVYENVDQVQGDGDYNMDTTNQGMNDMGPNGFDPTMMGMSGFNPAMPGMMPAFGNQNGFFPQNNFAGPYGGRGRGGYGRGGYRGRGGYNSMHGGYNAPHMAQQTGDFTVVAGTAEGPPIDAPKGPKAMREGLPNSGIYSRPSYQGTKGSVHGTSTPQPSLPAQSPPPQRERSRSPARDDRERARSASHSRSGSRSRKRKHSVDSQNSEAYERRRERRRRHERRYDDEQVDTDKKDISRSDSGDEDSSRRSRRRRDKEKEKHRSSRTHRDASREHRHRRHRSRSARGDEDFADEMTSESNRQSKSRRDRDREREKERQRDRDKDRDRDRDRKRSRRDRSASANGSSRRSRRDDRTTVSTTDDQGFKIKGSRSGKSSDNQASFAPPTGPRKDRDRDSRNSRPSVQSAVAAAPSESAVDPYALEREARIKERMAKEQQRRESATTGKRPRTSIDEGRRGSNAGFNPPSGPRGGRKGRKVSYKYEDEEGEEARADRVEREREAGRWN